MGAVCSQSKETTPQSLPLMKKNEKSSVTTYPAYPPASYIIRVAIIGNQTVGKSSLINRFAKGSFKENSLPETDSA